MTTRTVQIFPNDQDTRVLKRWCGLYRRMYNLAVARMLDTGQWHSLGHKVLTTFSNIPKKEWVRFLPTNIRKEAYKEASFAMSKAMWKNNVKFKTLKRCGRTLKMEAVGIKIVDTPDGKRIRFADNEKMKQLSKEFIRFDENGIKDINPGSRVQVVYDGRWWLISSFKGSAETQGTPKVPIVALDPGVRTFQTAYSPEGATKLGDQASCRIFRLMRHVDRLVAFKDRRSREKRLRLEKRIKNLVNELHWKIARKLASEYDTIIIPAFETQQMAKRRGRKINKTAVRMMLRLSHYTFRCRLQHVANKLGSRVIVGTEEYTSKTCGCCGVVHKDLGSAKVFKCPNCDIWVDRDLNGARNIYIKLLAGC